MQRRRSSLIRLRVVAFLTVPVSYSHPSLVAGQRRLRPLRAKQGNGAGVRASQKKEANIQHPAKRNARIMAPTPPT
eukprot:9178504-Prorocentrum_lima.AAC.1